MDLSRIVGFDWDAGNARKNEVQGIGMAEAEQVFFNQPLIVPDSTHSGDEQRYHALALVDAARLLHVTFTLRDDGRLIRVISARPASRKERAIYAASQNSEIQE